MEPLIGSAVSEMKFDVCGNAEACEVIGEAGGPFSPPRQVNEIPFPCCSYILAGSGVGGELLAAYVYLFSFL